MYAVKLVIWEGSERKQHTRKALLHAKGNYGRKKKLTGMVYRSRVPQDRYFAIVMLDLFI